jgi:hypothetical protein
MKKEIRVTYNHSPDEEFSYPEQTMLDRIEESVHAGHDIPTVYLAGLFSMICAGYSALILAFQKIFA